MNAPTPPSANPWSKVVRLFTSKLLRQSKPVRKNKVSIGGSDGNYMTITMTDREFALFNKIMREEKLPHVKAYIKMLKTINQKK